MSSITRSKRLALALFAALPVGAAFLTPAVDAGEPLFLVSGSVEVPGTADEDSFGLRWDDAGRFAVFLSESTDLVPAQNTLPENRQAFLYDRLQRTVSLISHVPGSSTTGSASLVLDVAISGDGNWVAFSSAAVDLVTGHVDTNDEDDVFLWSRESDEIVLVSHAFGSPQSAANGVSRVLALPDRTVMSHDGRFVAFESNADDLLADLLPVSRSEIYLFDRDSGTHTLVSHGAASGSAVPNGVSRRASLSADGRWLAFETLATNLVAGIIDDNSLPDVYLWDRLAPAASSLRLLSRKSGAPTTTGNQVSGHARISSDGSIVGFASAASDLEGVSQDANGSFDLFAYDRLDDQLLLVSHRNVGIPSQTQTGNAGVSTELAVSANGSRIAFGSTATNHVVGQVDTLPESRDVFLWIRAPLFSPIILVSHVPGSPATAGGDESFAPAISPNGRIVAFASNADDLVAGMTAGSNSNVFVRDGDGVITLVSHLPDDLLTGGDASSVLPSLAAGGRVISFESQAQDLATGPDNNLDRRDLFVHGGPLFTDGFETGDLSTWAPTSP